MTTTRRYLPWIFLCAWITGFAPEAWGSEQAPLAGNTDPSSTDLQDAPVFQDTALQDARVSPVLKRKSMTYWNYRPFIHPAAWIGLIGAASVLAVLAFLLFLAELVGLRQRHVFHRLQWWRIRLSTMFLAVTVVSASLALATRQMPARSSWEIFGNLLAAVPFVGCLLLLVLMFVRDAALHGEERRTRSIRELRDRLDRSPPPDNLDVLSSDLEVSHHRIARRKRRRWGQMWFER